MLGRYICFCTLYLSLESTASHFRIQDRSHFTNADRVTENYDPQEHRKQVIVMKSSV
jgi:hypothetical protein